MATEPPDFDGTFRWFLTRATPLRDARGVIVRWIGTNTDVNDARHERERAEALAARLSLATQRLQAAQRAANVGIFDWDLGNDRMNWSPEVYRLMGLAPFAIEATSEAWAAAMIEDDREVPRAALRDATTAQQAVMEIEVRLRQVTGAARWVRLSTEIEYGAGGAPVRLLGAMIDIQALKEAAAVRLRALDVAERTSRAKDEFLATMSHELRTPLNAMLGWARLLHSNPMGPDQVAHGLDVIKRTAETQARLIDDLLDVSRIISGKLRLTIDRLLVSDVVLAAVEVVRQAVDAKGIQLIVHIDPDVGSMVGDADRLQQIVWNLLNNAVKFTPANGRVTVTATRVDSADGMRVSIRVDDTGAGIAREHVPLIFERFQQVDSTTTRRHGGLGLGLAIVRHLAEAHGGTVTARSDGIGAGASFIVTLPMRAVFAPAQEERLIEPAAPDAVAPTPAEERRN